MSRPANSIEKGGRKRKKKAKPGFTPLTALRSSVDSRGGEFARTAPTPTATATHHSNAVITAPMAVELLIHPGHPEVSPQQVIHTASGCQYSSFSPQTTALDTPITVTPQNKWHLERHHRSLRLRLVVALAAPRNSSTTNVSCSLTRGLPGRTGWLV